jgi:nicotinamidase-related amidase
MSGILVVFVDFSESEADDDQKTRIAKDAGSFLKELRAHNIDAALILTHNFEQQSTLGNIQPKLLSDRLCKTYNLALDMPGVSNHLDQFRDVTVFGKSTLEDGIRYNDQFFSYIAEKQYKAVVFCGFNTGICLDACVNQTVDKLAKISPTTVVTMLTDLSAKTNETREWNDSVISTLCACHGMFPLNSNNLREFASVVDGMDPQQVAALRGPKPEFRLFMTIKPFTWEEALRGLGAVSADRPGHNPDPIVSIPRR